MKVWVVWKWIEPQDPYESDYDHQIVDVFSTLEAAVTVADELDYKEAYSGTFWRVNVTEKTVKGESV